MADHPPQPLLKRQDGGCGQYQKRNHQIEGALRGGQQQQAAQCRAGDRGRDQRQQRPAGTVMGQPSQVGATARDTRRIAREHRDGVGDVRRYRTEPGREQRRKRDQRAATGDRVDRTGGEPGTQEQCCVGEIHTAAYHRGCDGRVDRAVA